MKLDRSYIPETDNKYAEYTDAHIRPIEYNDGTVFDENYPYIDKSKKFKRNQRWVRFLLRIMIFPFSYVRMGLRIRGKENLKKNKELLKQGCLSISNHINMWDYIAVMNAVKPFKPHVLVLKDNVSDKSGNLVRYVGGIPIPKGDGKAMEAYNKAVKDMLLNDGGWLHLYPEASMWEWYRYIRPFKKGVGHYAKQVDKPVLPLAFSYRKPSWIRKHLFKQPAAINLFIGEPLFINKELPEDEQVTDLVSRCHQAVVDLAGIDNNPYEAIYHDSKRIEE